MVYKYNARMHCGRQKQTPSHVRVIYTQEEDRATITSPAKAVARRVDTVPSSSDEEDTVKKRRNQLFEGDNSKHHNTKRRRSEKKRESENNR